MPPHLKSKRSPEDNSPYECTACQQEITSTYEANLHPLIATLVCRQCYANYGTGNFAEFPEGTDKLGDDNYCRWCVDGGKLFGCGREEDEDGERCHYAFCRDCISHNVPDDPVLTVDPNDKFDWHCYACDDSKLKRLRRAAKMAMKDLSAREARRATETETRVAFESTAKDSSAKETPSAPESEAKIDIESTAEPSPTNGPEPLVIQPTPPEEIQQAPEPESRIDIESTAEPCPTNGLDPLAKDSTPPEKVQQATEPEPTIDIESTNGQPCLTNGQQPSVEHSMSADENVDLTTLSGDAIKTRLATYRKIKDSCIEEINLKFDIVTEMFTSASKPKLKNSINIEISSLQKPLKELEIMLCDLRTLGASN